jgi:hypothetical protein
MRLLLQLGSICKGLLLLHLQATCRRLLLSCKPLLGLLVVSAQWRQL